MIASDVLKKFAAGDLFDVPGYFAARATQKGGEFALWAPGADEISVLGDWNGWQSGKDRLEHIGYGVFGGEVAGLEPGALYKYRIRRGAFCEDKADPVALAAEVPPRSASRLWRGHGEWHDQSWMAGRGRRQWNNAPQSIYEVHLGSWKRGPSGRFLNYREVAPLLIEHVARLGFTHVEFLPLMEHPFYGSWGYQVTGYFAPTSRYGSPDDLVFLVDALHEAGIGVIFDWVPSHFPHDGHGLARFNGEALYEHPDHRRGYHPEWRSAIFDYGRPEVVSFLISSALYWLEHFHGDGLRVDGVASMLYLDYARKDGEWQPNMYGGRENLEAVAFLRKLTWVVHQRVPEALLIAEESTAWPSVTRGEGLGFDLKWDMGWMHDTLKYFQHDPVHRSYHHNQLTFRQLYAGSERFVLALSHDEVVHGKGALLGKMPGDDWQQRANLRLLYGYQFAQNGKKLLFMGGELGTRREWAHDSELEWSLLGHAYGDQIALWLGDLARLYRQSPALHEGDTQPWGFEWVNGGDAEQSVLTFVRWDEAHVAPMLVVCNFTPVVRDHYRVGAPNGGVWRELLNSDAAHYGGSGIGNLGSVHAHAIPWDGREVSLSLRLPPLGILFLDWQRATD